MKESANEKLGLPRKKMERILVAFDVDGTLLNNQVEEADNFANERIRTLLITLSSFKNVKILVWSGGGELYARQMASQIGITKYVDRFATKDPDIKPDIAIDDIQDTALGKLNLIVREK